MPLLNEKSMRELAQRLQEVLVDPVELILYVRPESSRLILPDGHGCQSCAPMRELADALVEQSGSKISLEVVDNYGGDVPALTVRRSGEEARIVFKGLPGGYEFATLIDAVERLSKADSALSPQSTELIDGLDHQVDLMVFVTPSCPYCPAAAATANRMTVASPLIRSTVIEANEFADLSQRFGVRGVPQTVVNGHQVMVGALPELEFVARATAAVISKDVG